MPSDGDPSARHICPARLAHAMPGTPVMPSLNAWHAMLGTPVCEHFPHGITPVTAMMILLREGQTSRHGGADTAPAGNPRAGRDGSAARVSAGTLIHDRHGSAEVDRHCQPCLKFELAPIPECHGRPKAPSRSPHVDRAALAKVVAAVGTYVSNASERPMYCCSWAGQRFG